MKSKKVFWKSSRPAWMPAACLTSLIILWSSYATLIGDSEVWEHKGICDASGVVDVGNDRFAVADDELNVLLVYQRERSGDAEKSFDISEFLKVVKEPKGKKKFKKEKQKKKIPKAKEVDIEAAARLNDTVFWIASHGRKKSGKEARERMRLFATRIEWMDDSVTLHPTEQPYSNLLPDLLSDNRYSGFGLEQASKKAPKETGGLNIEALTDRPDGTLLIGFRNPLVDGKALIAPLLNPHGVIRGKAAVFGNPILLPLDGRGMRGIASHKGSYLIVANDPEGDSHRPLLYRWTGEDVSPTPISSVRFGDFNPEAVAILPDSEGGRALVLSDDGSQLVGGERCKDLKDRSLKSFRSAIFRDPELAFY